MWAGWDESFNTWEGLTRIDPNLVREYDGKPARRARVAAPPQFKRGAGCARARLSVAEQKRGGVPQTMSMVCGNVLVHFTESIKQEKMPTLSITFYVLTMDKTGHITWPTDFDTQTRAQLRVQARKLLKSMIDDPLNPVDETMAPALTGAGTSALWQGAPRRQLVVVQPEVA